MPKNKKNENKRIMLFGVGFFYNQNKHVFDYENVVAIIDNDTTKHTNDKPPIVSPSEWENYSPDMIIIMMVHCDGAIKQLLSMGVPESKIKTFEEYKNVAYRDSLTQAFNSLDRTKDYRKGTIAFFFHDMGLNGAVLVFYDAMRLIREAGYSVCAISLAKGPMNYILQDNDIDVISIMESKWVISELDWIKHFDLIFVNTITLVQYLSGDDISKPIIWWLHELNSWYNDDVIKSIGNIKQSGLIIKGVSIQVCNLFNKYSKNKATVLNYGIDDHYIKHTHINREKIKFAIVGTIERRKGHDIVNQAIKHLQLDEREKIEVLFIGQAGVDNDWVNNLELDDHITVTGLVNRNRIFELYEELDCLLCPSREDAMPVVVTEAMMMNIPCVVSETVGQSKMIDCYAAGIVVKSGDSYSLSSAMRLIIKDEAVRKKMGENARKCFEDYFSNDKFSQNLLSIIDICDV